MSRPRKPSIWTRLAALEGKRPGRFEIMRQLNPEHVAASILIALQGRKYDPEALSDLLECPIEEAQKSIALMKQLDGLRFRGNRGRPLDEETFLTRLGEALSGYEHLLERASV